MGKEYTIDLRIWAAFLALAYYLGQMNVFGMLFFNKDHHPSSTTTTPLQPSSQHFQLDFKGASKEFLQSKEQLIQVITDASNSLNNDDHVISATCQEEEEEEGNSNDDDNNNNNNNNNNNKAILCLGVLRQGQISIQTWPHNNAISVDILQYSGSTTQDIQLPSLVSTLQQSFGLTSSSSSSDHNDDDDVASFWSLDYRGQDIHNRYVEAYSEVSNSMICKVKELLLKEEFFDEDDDGDVNANNNANNKLEIWKVLDIDITLTYEDAVEHNLQPGDPRWTNNELAKPMTMAFWNGHTLVTTDPEDPFVQEIMVHPAIMTQEHPNKIAILGGPGSILYETLKCKLVESVTWFQPNQQLVQRIQEFIPQTYDCSDLQGRSDNCLEDSTLSWKKQNAKDYFGGGGGEVDGRTFDVIYSQVDQPNKAEELSSYVASVMQALSPDGALMLSLGQAPTILHPRGDIGHFAGYEKLFQTLEGLADNAVHSMMVFEEDFTLSGFSTETAPETFMLVCKSVKCRQRFHAKPEWIESQLPERYLARKSSKNKKPILEYYDGAVQARMQVPPKAYETIYCRREPMPIECAYRTLDFGTPLFEFDAEHADQSAFELSKEAQGGGVLAKVDIPVGSYILAKDQSRSLIVSEETLGDLSAEPGHVSLYGGTKSRVLEMGIAGRIRTITTANAEEEESNVGCWFCPQESERPKYSPVFDRHFASFDSFLVTTKDISKGEELVRLL